MQSDFLVQNPHTVPVTKTVQIDGQDVIASINGFEVDLLSADGMSGTLTMRYFGQAAKDAEALFVSDSVVTCTFAAKEEAPE